MPSVSAKLGAIFTVTESFSSSDAPASANGGSTRQYSAYNKLEQLLNASTTPLVDTVVDLSRTLAAASETQDLTAAPEAQNVNDTVDLTGKKLIALIIVASASNNAAGLTIDPGATNGYNFLGDAAYGLKLWPGSVHEFWQLGAAAGVDAVGSSAKNLDFAGTVGDVVSILALFGTQA